MTAIAWQWSWPGLNTPLLVSQEVASLLEGYRQMRFDVERGGQLFVDPSSDAGLVLALATPPHKDDRAGRTWLDLNARRCRKEIELANAAGLRLVGYWHTHPQSIPMISPLISGVSPDSPRTIRKSCRTRWQSSWATPAATKA